MSSPFTRSDYYGRRERSRSHDNGRRRRYSPERSSRRRSHSRDRFPGGGASGGRGSRRGGGGSSRHPESDNEFSTKGQGPPRIEGMVSLKVDNITHRTSVSQLKRLFSRYGDLGDIYVPRYPDSNMTRGFAFVRYYRKRDAEEAMRKLDGERVDGRVLSIQMAKYARPSSSARKERRDRYTGGRRQSRSRSPRRRRRTPSPTPSRSRSRSRSPHSRSRSPNGGGGRDSIHSNRSGDQEHGDAGMGSVGGGSRSPSIERGSPPIRRRSEERGSSMGSDRSGKDGGHRGGSPIGSGKYNSDDDGGSDDQRRANGKGRDWDNQSEDN